jgi:hypothetical protein
LKDSLAIIIRTAGERTVGACWELAAQQAEGITIEVIKESPFEAALQKTYEIGIGLGRPWTMTLDGDVLLRAGALSAFLAAAEALPDDYVQVEGRVHDNFFGSYRHAGHRIYRTSLLPEALKLVPLPGEQIRPEFSIIHRLALLGLRSRRLSLVMGVHDHEQFYRDVYRKAFVHGKKHPEFAAKLVTRARSKVADDPDFLVFLRGLWNGLEHSGPVSIDVKKFGNIDSMLSEMSLAEKTPAESGQIGFETVERILSKGGRVKTFPPYDLLVTGEWGPRGRDETPGSRAKN